LPESKSEKKVSGRRPSAPPEFSGLGPRIKWTNYLLFTALLTAKSKIGPWPSAPPEKPIFSSYI